MKYCFVIISFLLFPFISSGQEVLTGLTYNPVIKHELKEMKSKGTLDSRGNETVDITLPFFDDFHQENIFPEPERWATDETYVNADFPYHSANVGAATLDAIDARGNLYPEASTFPFIADHLASNLIRLDSVFTPGPRPITISDSIYFSFFYQLF